MRETYSAFRHALASNQFHKAYSLMSPEYRRGHSMASFTNDFAKWVREVRSVPDGGWRVRLSGQDAQCYCNDSIVLDLEKVEGKWFLTSGWTTYFRE